MGALRFRLTPPELAERMPELAKAYTSGQDRTPSRTVIELRPGFMTCQRESPESGRLHVPWPVSGYGVPIVATATLTDRSHPFDLAVELARGKLNEVRNQVADWCLMGLQTTPELDQWVGLAQKSFAKAATNEDPQEAANAAQFCLEAAFTAGRILIESYTAQVLERRLEHTPKLSTLLACDLEGEPKQIPWATTLLDCLSAGRIRCDWSRLEPVEGKFRWDEPDAQLAWCRRRKLATTAGPILELRPNALPDWLWLWEGDFEEIEGMASELVRAAVARYKGKVAIWHVAHRVGTSEVLGLSEEEQIRLTAKLLQTARQADPNAQLVVDFDIPWAEWMASSNFQLGPLHLADSLSRAELGLAGVGLEIAPGFSTPGSHFRDLFEFSRLLDLYALVNLPLHVTFAIPSAAGPDSQADRSVSVESGQWPEPPNENIQRELASHWVALAIAKPFVRSVTWLQATDATPHLYPHAGLFRPDGSPKPLVDWLKGFREKYLA
jgi:GH35 family endo-1,4-beta-xylanase